MLMPGAVAAGVRDDAGAVRGRRGQRGREGRARSHPGRRVDDRRGRPDLHRRHHRGRHAGAATRSPRCSGRSRAATTSLQHHERSSRTTCRSAASVPELGIEPEVCARGAGRVRRAPTRSHAAQRLGERDLPRRRPRRPGRLVLRVHRHGYHTREAIESRAGLDRRAARRGRVSHAAGAPDAGRPPARHRAPTPAARQRNVVAVRVAARHRAAGGPARSTTSPSSARSPPGCTSTPGSGSARPGSPGSAGTTTPRSARRRAGAAGRTASGVGPGRARRPRPAGRRRCSAGSRAFGTGPDRFGLVHADTRLANLLVDGDSVSASSTSTTAGFSWFLYDLGTSLSLLRARARGAGAGRRLGHAATAPSGTLSAGGRGDELRRSSCSGGCCWWPGSARTRPSPRPSRWAPEYTTGQLRPRRDIPRRSIG